jgi:hypothetical protein
MLSGIIQQDPHSPSAFGRHPIWRSLPCRAPMRACSRQWLGRIRPKSRNCGRHKWGRGCKQREMSVKTTLGDIEVSEDARGSTIKIRVCVSAVELNDAREVTDCALKLHPKVQTKRSRLNPISDIPGQACRTRFPDYDMHANWRDRVEWLGHSPLLRLHNCRSLRKNNRDC